jgi:hypothetical protein
MVLCASVSYIKLCLMLNVKMLYHNSFRLRCNGDANNVVFSSCFLVVVKTYLHLGVLMRCYVI